MTHEEAKRVILNHQRAHLKREPFAVLTDTALDMAIAALEKQIPKKPEMEAMDGFDPDVASELCCPSCLGPVTNYWAPGTPPEHCQFCGQALDWEGAEK